MDVIWSKDNKLEKIKWLEDENSINDMSSLQIQKFLFFSEMFNRETNQNYDLYKLKAYKKGPVFSDVYGDYTYRKDKLLEEVSKKDISFSEQEIENMRRAKILTLIHNNQDLSNLTHKFDLWKSKEERLHSGEREIKIQENDITLHDSKLFNQLYNYVDTLKEYKIVKVNDKVFLFKENEKDLLEDHMLETLEKISEDSSLINPVYVDIEDGVLVVD
ncbi:hypothetical protein NGB30_00015 [Mammaliicoccus fleurettii]|uniref:hypothetical protein n=1 Tax=Mammaliicoccus TaxID=2803850 RepID=UPI001EFA7413|nr:MULTISPECIES: hypothetical protein [Mammaliicoccus]MEB7778919.1 hypothetical protein [Mammaliicoccus fleurettii]